MFDLMEPREMDTRVDDVPRMLRHIHESVYDRLRDGANRTHLPLRKNAKGDAQQPYDVVADAAILRVLETHAGSGILWSEESGEIRFEDGRPLYRFVVDPVDGSDNWGRGLPLSAVSVAVLPADSPITPARVCWAMVGDLRERLPLTARHGYGGYMGPGESAPPECRRCLPPFCRVSSIILIRRHRSADSCSAHGASAPMAAPRRL